MPSGWYLSQAGAQGSATDFARMVYDNKPHNLRSVQEAEAVFRHNNAIRTGLSPWGFVNLNPFPLTTAALNQWQTKQHSICATLNANPGLYDFLLMTTYGEQQGMLSLADAANKSGWTVGKKEIIETTGYAVSGASGGIAAGEKPLAAIQSIAKELMNDAVKKHGKDILQKKNLKALEFFLKNNAKFPELQKSISVLPSFLSRNLGHIHPTPGISYPNARFVRSQILLPFHNPQRYCNNFESLLKSKVVRLGKFGTGATWILPAAIGVYNVYDAPQEKMLEVTARETAGIGLGALGTELGIAAGIAIAGTLLLTGGGAFIVIAVVAGAGGAGGYWVGSTGTDIIFKGMGW